MLVSSWFCKEAINHVISVIKSFDLGFLERGNIDIFKFQKFFFQEIIDLNGLFGEEAH